MAAVTVNSRRESVVGDLRMAIVNLTGVTSNTFTPGWDSIFAVTSTKLPSAITGIAIGSPSITTPPAITFTSSGAMTNEIVICWGR